MVWLFWDLQLKLEHLYFHFSILLDNCFCWFVAAYNYLGAFKYRVEPKHPIVPNYIQHCLLLKLILAFFKVPAKYKNRYQERAQALFLKLVFIP
jgi:hypothetical protein